MHIFIDESGSFSGFHPNSVSVVGALVIPDVMMDKLGKKYAKFRDKLPKDNGEVKGRLLNEKQVDKVVTLLVRNEALFEITALDLGLHQENAVRDYKQKLGEQMLAKVANFREDVRPEVQAASEYILQAPLNLFLQALTTFDVLHRVIGHSTSFFAQRKPYELGSFSWVVDGKEPTKVTRWEEWWAHYAQGALASMSQGRPAFMLPPEFNADYSHYEKFNAPDEKGDPGTSLKLLLKDLTFSSEVQYGLEFVDILTNAVRRALTGNLQREGWQNFHRLMIHGNDGPYISFVLFSEGKRVGLRHQIPRPGGRPVKSGTVFDQTPEEEAFRRWREGKFDDVERITAAFWREALEKLDLLAVGKEMRSLGFTQKACKTLQDAKAIADALVNGTDKPYDLLTLAIHFFHIPQDLHPQIAQAWQTARKRTLPEFAPYAAYALTVEIFFQIALGAGLIGGERPSNRTDIAYLFYLPFSTVFVSSDDLHRRAAPLFMRADQAFVWGIDLKQALRATNIHFLQLPEEDREKGISAFAHSPPAGNLVAELWDRFMRRGYRDEEPVTMSPDKEAELVKRLKDFAKQPTLSPGDATAEEDPEMISVSRLVRKKRGSWWQLPKDYEEQPEAD